MKKIKLPLEMANGVMVRSLDELRENWDLEKIVSHYGDGSLVTWLNDRYYTDLAEQVEKITATGAEAQKQLCAVFGMEFKQDEVVDAEAVAERKRKLDLVRQYTSDDEVLNNIDHVAFNQEDLADLLDDGISRIYLCDGKFVVPLSIGDKEYVGLGNVEIYIGKDEWIDFDKLGIKFENVEFDNDYMVILKGKYDELVEHGKFLVKQREYENALMSFRQAQYVYGRYGSVCEYIDKIEKILEKRRILIKYTQDENVLNGSKVVVFSQNELDILNSGERTEDIYLVNGKYKIPLDKKNRHYFGLGSVECIIDSDNLVAFKSLNISFSNIRFDERYETIVKQIPRLKRGECIELGYYGGQKIKWQVIDVDGSKALLFCVDGVDNRPFHHSYEDVTWENSDIRRWLNNDFYNVAFDAVEKKLISLSYVSDVVNPQFYTNPGNSTFDYIFLLSLNEVEKYVVGTDLFYAHLNEFLRSRGADFGESRTCAWYMRSPGDSNSGAAYVRGGVFSREAVRYCGMQVHVPCVIRPALWLETEP